MSNKQIVLDAMGVIYAVGDDVRDLLYPFVAAKGGIKDFSKIKEFYRLSSLGKMSARDFWINVNVNPDLEDEYLQGFRLTEGLLGFLEDVKKQERQVYCLSNDVSEWSKKLLERFGLARYISHFIISGDVGFRKPDPLIFFYFLAQIQRKPSELVFVDDNPVNLDAAAAMGFETILFKSPKIKPGISDITINNHRIATDFEQIKRLMV